MMSLWDALRMNMMISYQELVRTFLNTNENKIAFIITRKECEVVRIIMYFRSEAL